jgi:hypothetical protein
MSCKWCDNVKNFIVIVGQQYCELYLYADTVTGGIKCEIYTYDGGQKEDRRRYRESKRDFMRA